MRSYFVATLSLCSTVACVDKGYTCGEGTHVEDGACVADAPDADTGGGSSDSGTDTDSGASSDSGSDSGSDSEDGATMDTGPCAPPDGWSGAVPEELLTSTAFASDYDAGMATLLTHISGYGAGSFSEAIIVSDATVVALTADSRYESTYWYYVADGYATIPVRTTGAAEVGDKVTFAVTSYEGWNGVPLVRDPGSWSVESSGNPVAAPHLGAETVDYTGHYSELFHEAGELIEPSSLDCGTGYTCFVFEHDGVRDRIRMPALNDFGLDVDYDGGLCAELVAPAGIYQDSEGVQGYFLDVIDATWMRVWAKP